MLPHYLPSSSDVLLKIGGTNFLKTPLFRAPRDFLEDPYEFADTIA